MRGPAPPLVAGLAVFAACVALAPPGRHWLDAGEIVAAAHGLGIAHPPGHPVAILVGKALSLLVPFGSIAFRVTVASALALGASAAVAAHLGRTLLAQAFDLDDADAAWLAALVAVGAGACGPSLLQGVRGEVYALNALLTLVAVAALVGGPLTPRRLGVAALAAGLGLANHHLLLAAGVAPAVLVVGGLQRRRLAAGGGVGRLAVGTLGMGALGLGAYALLPIRALADPVANWGDPRTLPRFLWTVSAEVFRRFRGDAPPASVLDNAVDAVFVTMDSLGPLGGLVALVGFAVLIRRSGGPAVAVAAAVFGVVLTKVVLGFEPNNPDLRGYWLPAVLLLAPGAAAFAALVASAGRSARIWTFAVTGLWLLARLGSGGPPLPGPQAEDPRKVANASLASIPAHGVALLADFNLAFSVWASEAVEGVRPDVSPVIRAFVDHPGYVEHIGRRFPSLDAWRAGPCPPARVRGRVVHAELHHDLPAECLAALSPAVVTPTADALAGLQLDEGDLGSARWRTWQHWLHALHREARGDVAAARAHLAQALARAPADPELLALDARLTRRGAGPSGR